MRTIICLCVSLALMSCAPSREETRQIVGEEIVGHVSPRYLSSGRVIGPYSPAVRIGNFLFISGQIGILPETMELAGEGIEAQTGQALKNILSILSESGFDAGDVVQCTVYLRNISEFGLMNRVYSSYFVEGKYPTRTTVEVSNLPKNARIEITAVAYKSSGK